MGKERCQMRDCEATQKWLTLVRNSCSWDEWQETEGLLQIKAVDSPAESESKAGLSDGNCVWGKDTTHAEKEKFSNFFLSSVF